MIEFAMPRVALVFFGIAQVLAITAGVATYAELSDVNRKLPDDQQISYFGWHWMKYEKLDNLYRQHYPQGRLLKLRRICMWGGFVSMLLVAKFMHFF